MSEKRFGIKERATLLVLMTTARSLTNKEIKAIAGFEALTGKKLQPLYDKKLMETDRSGKEHVHSLTDDGWAWCSAELSMGAAPSDGSAGGALYGVLAGLGRYLSRTNLRLADIFQEATTATSQATTATSIDIEPLIRRAYRGLRKEPRGWVSLTQLRPLLAGLAKDEVDAALYRMNRTKGVNIIPQSNQKVLTAEDRKAMVRIGNEDKLLLSIDEP